jgi:hypothetical protein
MAGIRRRNSTIARRIYLTPELAGRVDLFLIDPIRKKPRYAALSVLCEKLLSEYLDKLKQPAQALAELTEDINDRHDN